MVVVIVFNLLYSLSASAQHDRGGFSGLPIPQGKNTTATDTLKLSKDSTVVKKIDTADADIADSEIKDKITYKATDSIIYDIATKKMYLYQGTETHYQKTNLQSDRTEFDWTTYTMTAQGAPDSTGEIVGKPIFKDGDKDYHAGRMMYNFHSQRGKVFEVMTQEGDAYLHSESVKKMDDNSWYGYKSKYTTCNLEHPHFYFKAKKVKVVPNKVMVTGPANLWVADIPTPLYIPFGIFPVKTGRRSGLIIPKYGNQTGDFFLKDGGYYFAINEHFSFRLTGDFYTSGTWGLHSQTQYNFKYKLSGSLKLDYVRVRPPDPDIPNAHALNQFNFNWDFRLDPKALPTHSFTASVNVISSGYTNTTQPTDASAYQNSYSSNINYSKIFPRAPFLSLTVSANHSQNIGTHTFSIALPVLHFGVGRVTPFKSKISTGNKKWYEAIGISYNFDAKNVLNTFDTLLSFNDIGKKMQNGIKQSARIDAQFKVFRFLSITPSFDYGEYWYFQSVNKSWINRDQVITNPDGSTITLPGLGSYLKSDTAYGFKSARDFSASIAFNTKVTGMFRFKHGKLQVIRHVFTPSISATYKPDFADPRWGNYQYVRQGLFDAQPTRYSHYDISGGYLYGIPQAGKTGSINWNLDNNFDIKIFSKKDTINHERKIENLLHIALSSGYNFAADSLRLLPFVLNGNIKIWNNISATFNANFDPYALGPNGSAINKFYWTTNHSLLRFTTGTAAISASFQSKPKSNSTPQSTKSIIMKKDYVSYNPNDYYDFDIPWQLGINYSFTLQRILVPGTQRDTLVNNQTFTVNGNFNLTPKWKISLNTGFDFVNQTVTYTHTKVIRDLHCWELSFDWTAWPIRSQQYSMEIKVKAATLQDLKLSRKSSNQPIY